MSGLPDFLEAAADLKTECWDLVRDCRVSEFLEASARLDALCEDFRRAHYPRARQVFVVCDRTLGQPLAVYRRTQSGGTLTVYDEAEAVLDAAQSVVAR